MDTTIATFHKSKNSSNQLDLKLSDHKVVEHAQEKLMKQCQINEDETFEMLSNMASQRNIKLFSLSNQLIETTKKLII